MTNQDIYNIFRKRYSDMKVSDYRPLSDLFIPKGQGITIWADNNDVILFFPKEGENYESNCDRF